MKLRGYEYVSKNENAFIRYCIAQATWLSVVNQCKVHLMCDAVQMKALVLTYNGRVLGKYEY